ncbi:MAG: hypothetical protein JEY96_01505 [Bacteroidales bacterium]|nr:hypothetical protein [Bacteroidales bacterium]
MNVKCHHKDTTGIEIWFDTLISQLKSDQIQLESNIASPEKKDLYSKLMSGKEEEFTEIMRDNSTIYFIEKLIVDYLYELKLRNCKPLKLALELSNSKVLVWAEIKDDDEKTEQDLILAEAKVNVKYDKYGFYISSTIIEKTDKLNIPTQYKPILN